MADPKPASFNLDTALANAKPGEDIHVPTAPGSVSFDSVGDHKIVYDGAPAVDAPAPVSTVADAAHQLAPVTAAPAPAMAPPSAPADDFSAQHMLDLEARQKKADQNNAIDQELIDHPTPPPAAPAAHPTQASMVPAGLVADVAGGVMEGPTMVGRGVQTAVHNMLDLADAAVDGANQGLALPTLYWKGFDGDPSTPHEIGLAMPADIKAAGIKTGVTDTFDKATSALAGHEPRTVTGGLIEGVSQFATGMAIGGKLLKGWTVAGKTGMIAKSMLQGALTDFSAFDAHQARFSDLLKKVAPAAVKPVFDYLASDPNDGEAEGRMKNAVEGLGLGAAFEGVLSGARALKAARITQRAAAQAAADEGLQGVIDAPQTEVQAAADDFHKELANHLGEVGGRGFTIKRKFPLTPEEIAAVAGRERTPPAAPGITRLYNGGQTVGDGRSAWASSDIAYAKGYGDVSYVDLPNDHQVLKDYFEIPDQDGTPRGTYSGVLPPEIAAKRKPLVETATEAQMGPNTIGLNYSKIADTDDLQAAAVQFYDAFHGELTDAKRGVQSIDKQIKDAFGEDVSKLLGAWKPGTAMASHELTALRFAQAGAMKDVVRLARAIAGGDSSLATQAAFLQAGGITDALSRAVEGGKAEAARTLRTLRETVPSMTGEAHTPEGAVEFYRKVDALVAGAGGKEMVERAAKAFLTVARRNPLGTSKFLRLLKQYDALQKGAKEAISVFLTNGLLSVPGNVANIFGNAAALGWEPMMRAVAPRLYGAVGAESHIELHEAAAMMTGMKAAFGDLMRLSQHINGDVEARAKGMGEAMRETMGNAKANTKAFSSYQREEVHRGIGDNGGPGMGGIERGPENDTYLGRAAKFMWTMVKLPGHANGLMDDFTKIIAGRAELHAQAYRQAMKDMRTGLITAEQVGLQMQGHIDSPSADILSKVIDAQKELSWTRSDGVFDKGMKTLRTWGDSIPIPFPLGTAALPFVRTPANVFSYGVRNSVFAPLSERWWGEALSEDGGKRQLAMTKFAMGSLAMMWVMDHVYSGQITGGGPADPAQRQAMYRVDPDTNETISQPYSFRAGDRWFDYSRLDPIATPVSISADISEAWLGNDWTSSRAETAGEAWSAGAMGVGHTFLQKSTSTGLADLFDAMAAANKGDVAAPEKFFENRAMSMVPYSSVLGSLRRSQDPYMREVHGFADKFKNSVPVLSKDLQPQLDLWGRKRTYDSGMGSIYDFLVPSRTHVVGGETIDREMLRLGFAKQMPPRSISMPGNQDVNLRNHPDIYNEIIARGGPEALKELNDLTDGTSPMSDYYDSLADGSDEHAPGSKARYIQDVLNHHFGQAKQSVKRDFADDLSQIAAEQANRRAAARAGP